MHVWRTLTIIIILSRTWKCARLSNEHTADTYLEGVLGWPPVRGVMMTGTVRPCPVRLAVLRSGTMQGIGVRWRRCTTPVSIITAIDAFVQVQASHGRGNPRRPHQLLVHTTAGLG